MAPTNNGASLLSEAHFMAFGAIIHQFAKLEALMVGIMCKVMNLDVLYGSMFTAELPYRGKRDTLYAIIRTKELPSEQIGKVNGYLGHARKWISWRITA